MARKRRNRLLIPEAHENLNRFKSQVMKQEGYTVNPNKPDDVKYEVASSLGIPLKEGYNGQLKSEEAGKVGGQIGGSMVREMIRMAQQELARKS